jgi:hypothetical protein
MRDAKHFVKLTENASRSYKIGVDEIEGLKAALIEAISPVRSALKSKIYWQDQIEIDDLEYKSREGFVPYSHNFGGVEIGLIIPECESCEFSFLEFGEPEINEETGEPYENEGELDAYLRVIIKFEGFDDDGWMIFYVNVSGGNSDAPYFRVSHLPDLFEAEFRCKTVDGIKRASNKAIKGILKLIK